MKCGQRMGRKPKLTEAQQAEARKRRAEGATLAELARSYRVGKSTIPGSPRFCDRPRQATARPAKYSAAPSRPRNGGIDCLPPCFILVSAASILDRLHR
jgi:Helix-turn-helix domain of resolvase